MSQSIAFEKVGQTLLIVHNEQAPSDQEWSAWIERMGKRDYVNILIFTTGGGPTTAQRARTNEFWRGKHVPYFALVTKSKLAIGLLTAFNWFLGDRLKPFSPENVDKAFNYIGVPDVEHQALHEAMFRLRTKVG
jgi:hypothetical protein